MNTMRRVLDTLEPLVFAILVAAALVPSPAAALAPAADPSFIFPTPIILADRVLEAGNPGVICVDVFSRTSVRYLSDPAAQCTRGGVQTFAAWRIHPCFSHAQCGALGHPEWWPGMRIAEPMDTALGRYIASNTTRCPAGGGGSLSPDLMTAILASAPCDTDAECVSAGYMLTVARFGFDLDDPDGVGPLPALAQTPELPCGLPYVLVQRTFEREWRGRTIYSTRLFKAVAFEQWASVYDAVTLRRFPQFAAIPPIPRPDALDFDARITGGGTFLGGDLGRLRVLLDRGNYVINGGLAGTGLLVVNGSLTVEGPFTFSGTLVVRNTLILGRERRLRPPSPER